MRTAIRYSGVVANSRTKPLQHSALLALSLSLSACSSAAVNEAAEASAQPLAADSEVLIQPAAASMEVARSNHPPGRQHHSPKAAVPKQKPLRVQDGNPDLIDQRQMQADFARWLIGFKQEALAKGIPARTFDAAFVGVQPQPRVVKADRNQAETIRQVWDYTNRTVTPKRIANGKMHYQTLAPLLEQIERRYQVDRETVLAIWAMETNYGGYMGGHYVIEALATLAWEGRRAKFFKAELIQALKILAANEIERENFIGSWAGAMGQPQFMPSSYWRTAVDFDGDGRRDIWTSKADALGSIAAYLNKAKWQFRVPPAVEVLLPADFNYALTGGKQSRSLTAWRQQGIRPLRPLAAGLGNVKFSLDVPAGANGPAFLISSNFRSIRRYNNSAKYALSVSLLGQQIAGGKAVQQPWPSNQPGLTKDHIKQMQAALNAAGFNAGKVDGLPGAGTRAALRQWQQSKGMVADGFPSAAVLRRMGIRVPATTAE